MSEIRKIHLTQGKVAIVSAEDYDFLMKWKWQAQGKKDRKSWYAIRTGTVLINGVKKRKCFRMHRVILSRMIGGEDFLECDHIDGDGLNNQRGNLRAATPKQNQENRQQANRNSMSGVRGVSWNKVTRKWVAHVCHNEDHIIIGQFDLIDEAEKAVIAAREKMFTHH